MALITWDGEPVTWDNESVAWGSSVKAQVAWLEFIITESASPGTSQKHVSVIPGSLPAAFYPTFVNAEVLSPSAQAVGQALAPSIQEVRHVLAEAFDATAAVLTPVPTVIAIKSVAIEPATAQAQAVALSPTVGEIVPTAFATTSATLPFIAFAYTVQATQAAAVGAGVTPDIETVLQVTIDAPGATASISGASISLETSDTSILSIPSAKAAAEALIPEIIDAVNTEVSVTAARANTIAAITDLEINSLLRPSPASATAHASLDMDFLPWWNGRYPYRRRLVVRAPFVGVSPAHPVRVPVPYALKANGKVRDDFEDLEVLYRDDEEERWIVLSRDVELDEEEQQIYVNFNLYRPLGSGEELTERYYIHYGNLDLDRTPVRPVEFIDEWPLIEDVNSFSVSYTRPGEHWNNGRSDRRGARSTFKFYGTRVRLLSEVGPGYGIAEVSLDDGPWQEFDLFSPFQDTIVVYSEENLSPGLHELRVRVAGRRRPTARNTEINVQRFEYQKPVLANDTGEEVVGVAWSR